MPGTPFHRQVAMDLVPQREWHFTMKLASGITAADVGKAVELSAANTVRLATDNSRVYGRLLQVENRLSEGQLLGLVALKFIDELPVKTGETVVVGGSVVGAGAGEVKPAPTTVALATGTGTYAPFYDNIVLEVRTGFAVVQKI